MEGQRTSAQEPFETCEPPTCTRARGTMWCAWLEPRLNPKGARLGLGRAVEPGTKACRGVLRMAPTSATMWIRFGGLCHAFESGDGLSGAPSGWDNAFPEKKDFDGPRRKELRHMPLKRQFLGKCLSM